MTTSNESLASLLASVTANCDEIGTYIQNTEFIVKKYKGLSALHGYHSSQPDEYLQTWCWTRSWDEYFSHIMDLWDNDTLSAMRFNAIIERPSAPASRLDGLVPKLEIECRRFPNMEENIVRNAREMHTCVNSFLNSADDGLNLWKRQENILIENEIRRRRPVIRQQPSHESSISEDEAKAFKEQLVDDAVGQIWIRRHFTSMRMLLTSNLALLSITGIISIISCIVQAQAFFLSNQLRDSPTGTIHNPDFYNALQTCLTQSLGLYTVVAPALRPGGRPRFGFWTWLLSILTLALGIASVAVYCSFAALSPLLAGASNVLQGFITLQLVFSMNEDGWQTRKVNDRKEV